jgi:hypothetical protein
MDSSGPGPHAKPKNFKPLPNRRKRANIHIDPSEYTSSYVPPPAPPEFDPDHKEGRAEARKELGGKIDYLLSRFNSFHDFNSIDSDDLATRWEGRVFKNVKNNKTFAGYDAKIALVSKRLDMFADCWIVQWGKGDTRTGEEAFEATVNACLGNGGSFEHAEMIFMHEQFHPVATDTEVVTGCSEMEDSRTTHRRALREKLQDIVKELPPSHALCNLDVVAFAAALEIREWKNENEHDMSYDERMHELKEKVDTWYFCWNEDDADENRGMTGYELCEECLYQDFGGKFIHDGTGSDDAMDESPVGVVQWDDIEFEMDDAPEIINPEIIEKLVSDIQGLVDIFPQDKDTFETDITKAVRELVCQKCIDSYMANEDIEEYFDAIKTTSGSCTISATHKCRSSKTLRLKQSMIRKSSKARRWL